MTWRDAIKKAADTAKDAAESLGDRFLAEIWPMIETGLLALAAKMPDDVRAGALKANEKVRAFLKEKAKPALAEILRNDDAFEFLAEMVHETLPRPARKRLKKERIVSFCFARREKLLASLEGALKPEPADRSKT